MTLILAASTPWSTVMASDRLVTLARGMAGTYAGDHDHLANKLIILITLDAAVVIGFTGSAYVGKIPTDEWIAETVSPGARLRNTDGTVGMFGFKARSSFRLHQAFNRIRVGLSLHPEGRHITILAAGWRVRRGLKTPINVTLRSSNPLSANRDLILRPSWPLPNRIQSVGANIDLRPYLRAALATQAIVPWQPSSLVSFFTNIIRETAETNRTVGRHVMSVVLRFDPSSGTRQAESLFDPADPHIAHREYGGSSSSQLVSFTPWFLTPSAFHSPTESTGVSGSASSFEVDGWTFTASDTPQAISTPSNVGWQRPQDRKPAPRR